jgi:hypothetical protein
MLQVKPSFSEKMVGIFGIALCSVVDTDRHVTEELNSVNHQGVERPSLPTRLHGALSQKMAIFILVTVKTSKSHFFVEFVLWLEIMCEHCNSSHEVLTAISFH